MAKKQTKQTDPVVIQALDYAERDPDLQAIIPSRGAIEGFFAGLLGFMREARALETQAAETLAEAKAIPVPTTVDEDEAVQTFARAAASGRRAIEAHWGITSTIHQIHRRLTARRDKGVKAYEEAQAIATRLHGQYRANEEARVREENRRRAEAEEQRAREQRARELADLEAEALKREAAAPDLSARESRFVALMVDEGMPADLAAERAGFQDLGRLMGLKKVQAAIKAAREAKVLREQAAAVQASPLAVQDHERVEAQIGSAGTDRRTWRGVIVDEAAFILAVVDGKLGIPLDMLQINPKRLNEEARRMKENLNRWPGVRAESKDTIV